MNFPSEREIRNNVCDRAGDCPFCEWSPEPQNVRRTESREYDEEYYSIQCGDCDAWYEDDAREWMKPVAPGEEQERISV